MPPDRGAVKKTSDKPVARKESKISIPSRDSRQRDANNVRSSRSKPETKSRDPSISRRGEKSKNEDVMTSKGNISKRSKLDSEKLKDVKNDINKDLRKVKETLTRNRTTNNSSNQPAKTNPVKASSEVTLKNRVSTRLNYVDARKVSKSSTSFKTTSKSLSVQPTKPDTLGRGDTPSRSRLDKSSTKSTSKPTNVVSERNSKPSRIEKPPQKLNRERTRTRTLSPHEVKIVRDVLPVAETSKKGSRTQVSSLAPKKSLSSGETAGAQNAIQMQSSEDVADSYEDDFEDYESDFEEDIAGTSDISSSASEMLSESDASSVDETIPSNQAAVELSSKPVVEEEKKMDSGNYDLTEGKRKGREMQLIKEAMEKENASISVVERRQQGTLTKQSSIALDEGFEDGKVDEQKTSIVMKKVGFINFANAKKRMEGQKVNAKAKKRSEELLQMIDLDVVNFSLLDLPPVPYEVFMKSYGRSNTLQASAQTNDDYVSEEIQTDDITMKNMWTQHPLTYRPVVDKEGKVIEHLNSQLHVEVGGDKEDDSELWKRLIKYDAKELNEFLLFRGQRVLKFLEQKSGVGRKKLTPSSLTSSISNGFFSLGVKSLSFLKERPVTILSFCSCRPAVILTVHSQNNGASGDDDFLKRCVICVWNIMKPSAPEKILVCSEEATSACFHAEIDYLIFAGLSDGSVCVWDLQESASAHKLVNRHTKDWILRSPTYSTAEVLKNEGHLTKVIGIQAILNKDEPPELKTSESPIQTFSVDMTGIAIVWTAIRSAKEGIDSGLSHQDLGLAHWGRVRLVRSISFRIFDGLNMSGDIMLNLECHDLDMDPVDGTNFYVCTNSGHVLHCLITGYKPHPKVYSSNESGIPPATCIACTVDHHMLVGFEGGILKLYCRGTSRPLATFAGTGDVLGQGPSILHIQWSPVRPAQFFILDRKSRIHLWNLNESDIHPIEVVAFNKKITCMALSPTTGDKPVYLVVGTAGGEVELYEMKQKFCFQSEAIFKQELQQFKLYAKSL